MEESLKSEAESIQAELRGSLQFIVGFLVFGAAVFCVLINLCFLAVANDLALKRAYLVISHADSASASEIDGAIETLSQRLEEDVRLGGRPVLCEEDENLIKLQPKMEAPRKTKITELLLRKTGVEQNWESFYLQNLPTARTPFRMPFLELSLLYYGWVIEVATIIFLSQSLRKPHVQMFLFESTRKPLVFLPIVTLLLFIPAWNWVTLSNPRGADGLVGFGVSLGCLVMAWLLFKFSLVRLTPSKMNEVGFHLLISSLFVQLLTAMGDPDVVYQLFSAPKMVPLRYLSWFIILCYPGLLLNKWIQGKREQTIPEPSEESESGSGSGSGSESKDEGTEKE